MRITRPAGRYAWVLAAPLMLAGLLTGLGPASASAATCHPGPVTQPRNPADETNQLGGVAVLSPCDVWVAGFTDDSKLGQRTLIEHWNGRSWTVVPSPHPGTISVLNYVRALSPTSIWAVGEFTRGKQLGVMDKTLILHYNGTGWKQVRSPSPTGDNQLYAVRPVAAKDAWAVGTTFKGSVGKTLILRWNGAAWKQAKSPNPAPDDEVFGVAATSRKDAWAVGETSAGGIDGPFRGSQVSAHAAGGQQTFILHWNGTAWKRVTSPSPPGLSSLNAVGVTSPSSAWAVGRNEANNTAQTLALRWNGHTWAKVATPAGPPGGFRELEGVYAISAGNAWAVGTAVDSHQQAIILHWNGAKWVPVTLPGTSPGDETGLTTVAASSASNVWAVGQRSSDGGNTTQALVFHCC